MSSTSLKEQIDILEAYLEFVEFEDFIPFVVTDPNNCVNIEEYVEGSVLTIDLSAVKAGDIKEFARKINSGDFRVVLFKNIDNIRSRKDKDAWLAIIVTALKGESCYILLNDKDLDEVYMPFKKLKAICTCSQYPDYLRKRMNLGKGPDFSHFTINLHPKLP